MEKDSKPRVSDEEVANLLQLMLQLRVSNPPLYQETIKSLGMEGFAEALEKQYPNEKIDESKINDASISTVNQLTEAIAKIRNEESKTGIDGLKVGKEPQVKGIHITPTAGFSYKTYTLPEKTKVFINITHHEAIGEPQMVKKLDAEGQEVEGLNVPMSVGIGRADADKKGQACTVYDIVVHHSVLKDCTEDMTGKYREFICQLGIQSIEQKYSIQLDKRYKIPKLSYMGEEIPAQYIKDKKSMPTIQEVKTSSSSSSTAAGKKSAASGKSSGSQQTAAVPVADQDLDVSAHWCALDTRVQSSQPLATDQDRMQALLAYCQTAEASFASDERIQKEQYALSLKDYVEPIQPHPLGMTALLVTADIQAYELLPASIQISISPYKVVIKLPQYKKFIGYFPVCIQPTHSFYRVSLVEGFVSKKRIEIILPLDLQSWDDQPDAGSKPWLLAQALNYDENNTNTINDAGDASNPYGSMRHVKTAAAAAATGALDDNQAYPEDKFHLNLPPDVDPYTGVKYDGASTGEQLDDLELPEDRFHKKDAASNYIINQREQAKKDKWEKYEKEKAERQNDPNVEYVDMEDFKPGGKYAPKTAETVASKAEEVVSEELRRAADVLAQAQELTKTNILSSSLWTELLD